MDIYSLSISFECFPPWVRDVLNIIGCACRLVFELRTVFTSGLASGSKCCFPSFCFHVDCGTFTEAAKAVDGGSELEPLVSGGYSPLEAANYGAFACHGGYFHK